MYFTCLLYFVYSNMAHFGAVCFVLMVPRRLCALHSVCARLSLPVLLRGLWLADLHYQP